MKHRTLWSIAFAKTVTDKHDLLSNAILGMTAFSPLAHTTSPASVCVCACERDGGHALVSFLCLTLFCTLNDLIGIGQPDQNA